nr:hypothetical protein [Pseudarthrobacter equi]
MLLAHGLFKATLFLVVGIIDHQSGTRDVRKLSGVFRSSRALGIVAGIGARPWPAFPSLPGSWPRNPCWKRSSTTPGTLTPDRGAWWSWWGWSWVQSSPSRTARASCGVPSPSNPAWSPPSSRPSGLPSSQHRPS